MHRSWSMYLCQWTGPSPRPPQVPDLHYLQGVSYSIIDCTNYCSVMPRSLDHKKFDCDPPLSLTAKTKLSLRTMAELQNQNRELFTWWQNSCERTGEPAKCVEYSQYAMLLNNAFLNEDICEEMEMC